VPKVDKHIKDIYTMEMLLQSQYALNAVRQINANYNDTRFSASEVFRGIHSFLTHVSNVSKLLWPARPRKKKGETKQDYESRCSAIEQRGKVLRKTLGLPDDEHVLKSRTLRDHLEHFDERLDEWAASGHRNIRYDYIGPLDKVASIPDSDKLRQFDIATGAFAFRGEIYDLKALASAVEELESALIHARRSAPEPNEGSPQF
jgi:hypothetical protein